MSLKTDYKDDILAVGNLRKYQMIQNNDGTVSFQDVTQYAQTGDVFGAGDINKTNQAVNEKFDSDDVVDPKLATEEGFAADAKLTGDALSELNKKIDNNVVGFIDTNSPIKEFTSTNMTWVATENCILVGVIKTSDGQNAAQVKLNGVIVAQFYAYTNYGGNNGLYVPVFKGQTVSTGANGAYEFKAYKML